MKTVQRNTIIAAAKELNETGLIETKIKTVAVKEDVLVEAFLTAIESIPEDKTKAIPANVADVYNAIVDELEGRVAEDAAAEAPEAGEDEAPEADADGPLVKDEDLEKYADQPKPEKPKKEKAPPKEKAAKAPKEAPYTRVDACAEVIKADPDVTVEDLAKKSNAIYVRRGGADNLKEAAWASRICWKFYQGIR